ncbi:TetR family transcriptional regulator [Undibacterium sp.]|jgi:TetR/AcrR family transcriptional repressor of nem operon|uniref:TetR family transcriptional regulator n=1 Tax=Undibacterium sp. TaxID=1914977 RepID=UPI002C0B369E|nr:TetR family transcriptional regulator [Undibacterium sp.]HTD03943.1 TetR family transcriptional regulator [Undibacterium sp.]
MPRVSREQAALNRRHIVEVAAELYRKHGLNGIGVADLMAEAGVTHGGFYGHFASKDALAAEACGLSFENSSSKWEEIIRRHGSAKNAAMQEIVKRYLYKPDHTALNDICPMPTLAADAMRQAKEGALRQAFTAGMRRLAESLISLMPDSFSKKKRRERGLASLALLVGAMTLARANADADLTNEILAATDKALSELAAG